MTRRQAFILSGMVMGAVLSIYLPIVARDFAWSEDYVYLDWPAYRLFEFTATGAKPLGGILLALAFPKAGTIAGLAWLRMIDVVGIAALALALARTLARSDLSPMQAGLFAISAALLPPFHFYAGWATAFLYSWACLMSILAEELWTTGETRRSIPHRAAALVMLCAAFLIYQPAAVFLWCIVGMRLTLDKPGTDSAIRQVVSLLLLVIVAGIFALLIGKATSFFFEIPITDRASLVDSPRSLASKAVWLVTRPTIIGVRPFAISRPGSAAAQAAAVATYLLMAYGLFLAARGGFPERVSRTILLLLMPLLAMLPNVVAAENQIEFRILPGLCVLTWWYIYFSGLTILKRLSISDPEAVGTISLGGACILAAWLCATNMGRTMVDPGRTKDAYIRSQLAAFVQGRHSGVYIVNDPSFWLDRRKPNIGMYSMVSDLQSKLMPVPNTRLLAGELGIRPAMVRVGKDKESAMPSELVIDLTPLRQRLPE